MARIILIEPDQILAGTYAEGLRLAGHSVIMCASAQAAIYAADDSRPDLVIMEVQLIGHSGIEFLYEFRSYPEWQAVPVLVQSQVPASEFSGAWQILQQELRIDGYLYKPTTTFRELLRHVTQALAVPVYQ